MNGESSEFQVAPESVLPAGNELQTAESTSQFNAHGFNNFQYSQPLAGAPSSNENNTRAPVYSDYYTSHADAQRQPNELACEQGTQSGVACGQDVLSHGNAEPPFPATTSTYHADHQMHNQNYQQAQEHMPAQQHFSGQAVIEYSSNDVNALAAVLGSTSMESPAAIIISSSKSPIVALGDEAADNSNLTFGNYEFCGSSPANTTTRPLDNPEARAMNFADNRLQAEARCSPNMQQPNMQAEGINTVLAHQWHERREKLPTTLDSAFYAKWQTNRAPLVNTAEIQNARKLLFSKRGAAEKKKKKRESGQVSQQPESSTPKQVEQQQEQQPHQPPHLYLLHQVQQQNHPAALAPDSPSSPQQFAPSPMSAISSTGSGQQVFLHAHPTAFPQMQMQEALMPNGANPLYNLLTNPLQQLLVMQALQQQQQQQQQQQLLLQQQQQQQQQYLQQPLIQPYQTIVSSGFFDNWQKHNQQMYGEALKENTVRHKGTNSSGKGPKRRKRQNPAVDVTDNKENASMSSSERPLVIDESTVQPSNVQMKCDNDLEPKLAGYEGQVEESVMTNLDATKKPTSNRGKVAKRGEPSKEESLTVDPTGMWLNDHMMFHDWLYMQQQSVDQRESVMVQCENPSME